MRGHRHGRGSAGEGMVTMVLWSNGTGVDGVVMEVELKVVVR